MCICLNGVTTTPVVSGCRWGPSGFHMPLMDIQLVDTSCSHQGLLVSVPGSLMIRNKWPLVLWNTHNNQSIPVGIIWSFVYQTPTTFSFSMTTLNMDSHLLGNWNIKGGQVDQFLLNCAAPEFIENIHKKLAFLQRIWRSIQTES